jgi:hypothetical protein
MRMIALWQEALPIAGVAIPFATKRAGIPPVMGCIGHLRSIARNLPARKLQAAQPAPTEYPASCRRFCRILPERIMFGRGALAG